MLIGYVCVSKKSQTTDLQYSALIENGVDRTNIYKDRVAGLEKRPGLLAALRALRQGDVLIVWKLGCLERSLTGLVKTVNALTARGIGFKVLTGRGASIDTTTSSCKLISNIFAALAEFEHEIRSERAEAGFASARARGKYVGTPPKMTVEKLKLAMSAMENPKKSLTELCRELDVTKTTLYRYVRPDGSLKKDGEKILLTGHEASIDTTNPSGFGTFAEFEHEISSKQAKAGFASVRVGGKKGPPLKMTAAKLKFAMAAMEKLKTNIEELCRELGVSRSTLYRYVERDGSLTEVGKKMLTNA